ncbi:MAG: OadG family protein [Sulfurospirillum sp.]|nr:OadG family protein [Sulfurospirillum sp.]MBL0703398.1 OadG family protein [Sulfurospirillum sp.]
MELNLVVEGLKFMVLGMVTVFLFLVLLVIVLHFQAKIINKFFPQKIISIKESSKQDNKALIAAITVAITAFKNSKN